MWIIVSSVGKTVPFGPILKNVEQNPGDPRPIWLRSHGTNSSGAFDRAFLVSGTASSLLRSVLVAEIN